MSQAVSLQEECLHRGAVCEGEKGGERFIVGEREGRDRDGEGEGGCRKKALELR